MGLEPQPAASTAAWSGGGWSEEETVRRMRRSGALCHCRRDEKPAASVGNNPAAPPDVKYSPHQPAAGARTRPREMKTRGHTDLYVNAHSNVTQPEQDSSHGEWISETWSIEQRSSTGHKEDGGLVLATTWMGPEDTVVSDSSQTSRATRCAAHGCKCPGSANLWRRQVD